MGQIKLRCDFKFAYVYVTSYMYYLFLYSEILLYQAHPWFRDVVWDKLYDTDAAFKPEVRGELDTQNFMKFDEVNNDSIFAFSLLLSFCFAILVQILLFTTSHIPQTFAYLSFSVP